MNQKMETVTVNPDAANYEKAVDFFNVYEYEMHININDFSEKTYVGDIENRKCRFCGKTKQETTFRKMAHIVPQFLGNRFLISAFECDNCNKLFGDLYENSFANFIGAFRPFSFFLSSKNNKNPKHKETVFLENEEKTKLSIQATDRRHINITYEYPFDDSVVFDKINKKLTVNATRKPYTPIHVYKMLVKMAISLINESEIENFQQTLKFLINNSQNDKFKGFPFCHVYMYSIYCSPLFATPMMYLYRKKDNSFNSPGKTFILYSGNHIYQIFIPLNKEDDWMMRQNVKLYPYPLLFDKSVYQNGVSYDSYGIMMDLNEKKTGEPQNLTFSYQEAEFNHTD